MVLHQDVGLGLRMLIPQTSAQLLKFDFDRQDVHDRTRHHGAKPRSIKEALIRWLETLVPPAPSSGA